MDFFNKLLKIHNSLNDIRIKFDDIFNIFFFLNSTLDLIQAVKFVKQLFRIQIQKGWESIILEQGKI